MFQDKHITSRRWRPYKISIDIPCHQNATAQGGMGGSIPYKTGVTQRSQCGGISGHIEQLKIATPQKGLVTTPACGSRTVFMFWAYYIQ